LTSNFFSLVISILAFGQKAHCLYLVEFFCVPIAIVLYAWWTPKEEPGSASEVQSGGMLDPMLGDGLTLKPEPDLAGITGTSEIAAKCIT
jgi:hypothetical protein